MGLIGTPPVVNRRSLSDINLTVDSTAQESQGQVSFFYDPTGNGRWSAVKYYKSGASVRLGAVLKQDTAVRDANQFIETAVTDARQNVALGIAAAAVSNTGYFSYCYVAGYCPEALMPTTQGSGQYLTLSGTEAGKLTSAYNNATLGNATYAGNPYVFQVFATGIGASGGSTASGRIIGWLGL